MERKAASRAHRSHCRKTSRLRTPGDAANCGAVDQGRCEARPNAPEIEQIDQLFSAIGQELSTHMLKEEQVLFPYVRADGTGSSGWRTGARGILRNRETLKREWSSPVQSFTLIVPLQSHPAA